MKRNHALVVSVSLFALAINLLAPLITTFSTYFQLNEHYFSFIYLFQYGSFFLCSHLLAAYYKKYRKIPKYILKTALMMTSFAVFLIGYCITFWQLAIVFIFIGGLGGIIESGATALLSENDCSGGKSIYLSQFFYASGAFFAPFLLAVFLRITLPLRWISLLVASGTAIITIIVFRYKESDKVFQETENISDERLLQKNNNSSLIHLSGTMVLYVILEGSLFAWFPYYLETAFSYTPSKAAGMFSLFTVGFAIIRFIYFLMPAHKYAVFLVLHSLSIVLSLICLNMFTSICLQVIFLLLLGIGCGPIWPLIVNYCSHNSLDLHHVIYVVGAGSLGALLGPSLTSFIVHSIGIIDMVDVLLFYGIILLILNLILSKRN
ncbi:MAG: MFS transporter [Sphaerochaetaceae bacterium]